MRFAFPLRKRSVPAFLFFCHDQDGVDFILLIRLTKTFVVIETSETIETSVVIETSETIETSVVIETRVTGNDVIVIKYE